MKDATKEMVKIFKAHSKKHPSGTNSTSVWFPVKQIELMMDRLIKENADGVRLYFGQYSDKVIAELNKDPNAHPIPKNYAGRNTIVFVSTKESGGIQKDYFENLKILEAAPPMEPENRGILCPPDTGCDNSSYIVNDNEPNPTFP